MSLKIKLDLVVLLLDEVGVFICLFRGLPVVVVPVILFPTLSQKASAIQDPWLCN